MPYSITPTRSPPCTDSSCTPARTSSPDGLSAGATSKVPALRRRIVVGRDVPVVRRLLVAERAGFRIPTSAAAVEVHQDLRRVGPAHTEGELAAIGTLAVPAGHDLLPLRIARRDRSTRRGEGRRSWALTLRAHSRSLHRPTPALRPTVLSTAAGEISDPSSAAATIGDRTPVFVFDSSSGYQTSTGMRRVKKSASLEAAGGSRLLRTTTT
jgi:hypothetical protein